MLINILLAIPLFLAYLSIYISPAKFWMLAFFGLAYPYFLILNIFFAIFWMYRQKWVFLISIISMLIGWNFLGQTFQINLKNAEYVGSEKFNFLSYNIRLFDKYNWTNDKYTSDKIVDFLENAGADVICLQEVPGGKIKGKDYATLLKNVLKNKKLHFASHDKTKTGRAGILTISKYPIVGRGDISFETSTNISIWTDIKIKTDTVRVYNLHLQSIHLDPSNYKFLDTLDLNANDRNIKEAEDIMGLMKSAYEQRAFQTDKISRHIIKSPYKVIVCGDFNDQPVSYTYHNICGDLNDAFIESGNGISNTYIGKFPSFRIDYILHSSEIISSDYKVTHVKLSDHYPIQCTLILN